MTVEYTWRGEVTSGELNELHAEAFDACGFTPTNGGLISLQA